MWIAVFALGVSEASALTYEDLATHTAGLASYRTLRMQADAPPAEEGDLRRLAKGHIAARSLSSGASNRAFGAAVIPLPLPQVWAALNDETRHPGYTRIGYSELLKGRTCQSGRRVLQFLPRPTRLVSDRWWIGILVANEPLAIQSGGAVRELTFTSSVDREEITSESGRNITHDATPIGHSRGAWFVTALDARTTYLEYYLDSDPGGSLSKSLASTFIAKGIKDTVDAIHRFAREGKPSCPIE